jgi:hypothetical protein
MTPGEVVAVVLVPFEANFRISFDEASRALWSAALAGVDVETGTEVARSILSGERRRDVINLATWRDHTDLVVARRARADALDPPEPREIPPSSVPLHSEVRAVLGLARAHLSTGHPQVVDDCPLCRPPDPPRYSGERPPCPWCGRPDNVEPTPDPVAGREWRCDACPVVFAGTSDEWRHPHNARRRRERGYISRRDVSHAGGDDRYEPARERQADEPPRLDETF